MTTSIVLQSKALPILTSPTVEHVANWRSEADTLLFGRLTEPITEDKDLGGFGWSALCSGPSSVLPLQCSCSVLACFVLEELEIGESCGCEDLELGQLEAKVPWTRLNLV